MTLPAMPLLATNSPVAVPTNIAYQLVTGVFQLAIRKVIVEFGVRHKVIEVSFKLHTWHVLDDEHLFARLTVVIGKRTVTAVCRFNNGQITCT